LAISSWGCTESTESSTTTGGSGADTSSTGSDCQQDTGTLTGSVKIPKSVTLTEQDQPAPGAIVVVKQAGDTPFQIMADEFGVYSVELQAGEWSIEGQDDTQQCYSMEPSAVTVTECQETAQDLMLDNCFG